MDNQIVRIKENSMIFGVCSGLEKSFGFSRQLIRGIFICMALFGGLGIIAYILLSIFIQKEITTKRLLGVFCWYSERYSIELSKFRLYGGLILFFLAHYGCAIYLFAFLWMKVQKFSQEKRAPNDNNQD